MYAILLSLATLTQCPGGQCHGPGYAVLPAPVAVAAPAPAPAPVVRYYVVPARPVVVVQPRRRGLFAWLFGR